MDIGNLENEQTQEYKYRYDKARNDTSTYRNCAGFVKYLLGIGDTESLVVLQDLSEKGLLKYLKPNDRLDLSPTNSSQSVNGSLYVEKASKSDVVGILVNRTPKSSEEFLLDEQVNNTVVGWRYVHFALVDPEDPSKVYQRPDLENKPEHVDWKNFVDELDEFEGMEKMIVFFDKIES